MFNRVTIGQQIISNCSNNNFLVSDYLWQQDQNTQKDWFCVVTPVLVPATWAISHFKHILCLALWLAKYQPCVTANKFSPGEVCLISGPPYSKTPFLIWHRSTSGDLQQEKSTEYLCVFVLVSSFTPEAWCYSELFKFYTCLLLFISTIFNTSQITEPSEHTYRWFCSISWVTFTCQDKKHDTS